MDFLSFLILPKDSRISVILDIYLLIICVFLTKHLLASFGYYYDTKQEINLTSTLRFIMSSSSMIVVFSFLVIVCLMLSTTPRYVLEIILVLLSYLVDSFIFFLLKKRYGVNAILNDKTTLIIFGKLFGWYEVYHSGTDKLIRKGKNFLSFKSLIKNIKEIVEVGFKYYVIIAGTFITFRCGNLQSVNTFFSWLSIVVNFSFFYMLSNCFIYCYVKNREDIWLDLVISLEVERPLKFEYFLNENLLHPL